MQPTTLREVLDRFPEVLGEECYAVSMGGAQHRVGGGIDLATLLDILVREVESAGGARADVAIFRVQYPVDTRDVELHRLLVSDGLVVPHDTTPLLVPRGGADP